MCMQRDKYNLASDCFFFFFAAIDFLNFSSCIFKPPVYNDIRPDIFALFFSTLFIIYFFLIFYFFKTGQ